MPISLNPSRFLKALPGIFFVCAVLTCPTLAAAPLKIMPMGDSITAGYTDNTSNSPTGAGGWSVPFEFGYRRQLYHLLTAAGYDFLFVGGSAEPFNYLETGYGDPTKGGTVSPTFDLRTTVPPQNGHRGYGGIRPYQLDAALDSGSYIENDDPDIILLMVGINGITDQVVNGRPPSTGQLDALVTKIFSKKPSVHMVVAEITPYAQAASQAGNNPIIVNYNTYIRDVLVPKFQGQGRSISRINQHKHFLSDPNNPSSATITSLYSNAINHPTNAAYDTMAQTWFEGILAVTPPTLPALDQTSFSKSTPTGGTIGNFAQPPAPSTETLSFSLISGTGDADNAKFSIVGNQLRTTSYNFSADPNGTIYSILVRATGSPGGQTGDRAFTLTLIGNPDSDDDGIPDAWESAKTGPVPNLTDLTDTGDFDNDGLTDVAEYNLSIGSYPDIDPTNPDTDGDGLIEGEETAGAGQRPPTDPTLTDTDGDDISDLNEDNTGTYVSILQTGTNPTIADSDVDDQPDGEEILNGTNPTVPAVSSPLTVTGVSNSPELAYLTDASAADLLHGLNGADALHTGWYNNNGATPAEIHDGIHGRTYAEAGNNVEAGWANATNSISTFTLPATVGGYGWDLSGITSIASWAAGAFGNQRYEVGVRKVGETGFTSIGEVAYQPLAANAAGSTKVQVSRSGGSLAINVAAIRFTMLTTTGNNGRSVYREIDVFGSESPARMLPPTEILAIAAPAPGKPSTVITWRSYPGKTYRVEKSDNLDQWSILETAFPSGGVTTRLQDNAAPPTPSRMFYRVLANP